MFLCLHWSPLKWCWPPFLSSALFSVHSSSPSFHTLLFDPSSSHVYFSNSSFSNGCPSSGSCPHSSTWPCNRRTWVLLVVVSLTWTLICPSFDSETNRGKQSWGKSCVCWQSYCGRRGSSALWPCLQWWTSHWRWLVPGLKAVLSCGRQPLSSLNHPPLCSALWPSVPAAGHTGYYSWHPCSSWSCSSQNLTLAPQILSYGYSWLYSWHRKCWLHSHWWPPYLWCLSREKSSALFWFPLWTVPYQWFLWQF